MQFIADMTRLEVTAADIPECSPLGPRSRERWVSGSIRLSIN